MDITNKITGLHKLLLPLLFSAMLTISACVEEQITPQENEKTITFSLNVPGGFTPHTYAIKNEDQTKDGDAYVGTIDVLIFKKDETDGNKYNYFSGPHYASLGSVGSGSVDVTIRIPQDVSLSNTDYHLEVFANSRSIINAASASLVTTNTKAQVFEQLILTKSGGWNADPTDEDYIPIPMHGQLVYNSTDQKSAASLVRMLARVDISNTVDAIGNFQLKNVHVFNYNTAGYVAPVGGTSPSVPTSVFNSGASSKLSYDTNSNNIYNEEIFLFEAAAGSAADFTNNPCIVIGGTYDGSAANSYYRIDFVETDGTYLPVLRNNKYTFTITKIFGPGYDTPEKAFASRPSNVEYTVEKWADSNIVDAAYNGQYMIGTSAAAFNFDSAAKTKDNGDNILFVQTNHPNGWTSEITYTDGNGWLSLINLAGSETVTSGSQGTTSLKLKFDANTSGAPRSAVIKLTAGNVIYYVNVTQSHLATDYDIFRPESASYALRPGERIFIPVSHANSGSTIKLNSSDSYTVEIDPSSTSGAINKAEAFGIGSGGHIYLESGSSTGTATINLKKGTETIHTWDIDVKAILLSFTTSVVYPMDGSNTYSVTLNETIDVTGTTVYISHNDNEGTAATSDIPPSVTMNGTTGTFNIKSIDYRTSRTLSQKDVTLSFGSSAGATDLGTATLNFITPEPESNSYIVNPSTTDNNKSILIPVSRANKTTGAGALGTQLTNESFTTELVWTDNSNVIAPNSNIKSISTIGTGSGGYVLVETGSGVGNAVVGIRKGNPASGGFLWSWHIWVISDVPSASSSGGFMDRNLGALRSATFNGDDTEITTDHYGLIYQWGRKDPFPGASAVTSTDEPTIYNVANPTGSTSIIKKLHSNSMASSEYDVVPRIGTAGNIDYATANPHTYYYSGLANSDWYPRAAGAAVNNSLWSPSTKTIYDPCPVGWRLPNHTTWTTGTGSDWTVIEKSTDPAFYARHSATQGGVYPAAGLRNGDSGGFTDVGSNGRYWAGSFDSGYGRGLGFNSAVAGSTGNGNRANGYSVRCLQE